ncbi:Sb-PDE family phosphodiesterase [Woodsholea maritima]|uniref:Sb-PDE family phosphodiesterase n=1 Tax=Woodsholea maritima TaxID=240237 RepID=UPI00035EF801|nr:Sb-PDE family phosphodiesterase [Woodsholea maritima]
MRALGGLAVTTALLSVSTLAGAQEDRAVSFPNTQDGRTVLAVDLHSHSVFSDGHVWPSIRVEEAVRDGLDALAFTEHLEHQPHSHDIPHPDRNRAHEVAEEHAHNRDMTDVMLINGAEVTRGMPPGHVNAVFVTDANALLVEDAEAAFQAAKDQGAFIFWNHPHWLPQAPDGIARITPMHEDLIARGLLHGVEVANGTLDAYSEHALQIALDHNLTILATSDIHGLVDWTHDAGHGGHRPMTLVLADEKSPSALKAALFEGQTVAWHYNDLIGREAHVEALVAACLSLKPGQYTGERSVLPITVENVCPLPFILQNLSEETFQNVSDVITVPSRGVYDIQVRMGEQVRDVALTFEVLNTQIRPREHLSLTLRGEVAAQGE